MKNVKLKFNDTWVDVEDGWLCIGDSENQILLKPEFFNKLLAAINYTHSCTELKTVNEPLPYAEWKANLKMQKIEETIFKIGNDYKTMNDLLDMYGSYCNSF